MPILFKDTTFQGANEEEPNGNKLNWSAGMMITVVHDFTAIFEPLIPNVRYVILTCLGFHEVRVAGKADCGPILASYNSPLPVFCPSDAAQVSIDKSLGFETMP